MKILVLGQGKSGTSAVFYGAVEGVPNVREMFEPARLEPEDLEPDRVVVKKLIEFFTEEEAALLPRFDRRLFLVRDPRDTIISRLLYTVWDRRFIFDDADLTTFLSTLRRKELDPGSVSVRELYDLMNSLDGCSIVDDVVALNAKTVELWQAHGHHFHLLRYEDFVTGQLGPTNDYLGFSLNPAVQVADRLKRVERRKSHGDFKDWFAPDDATYFAERFADVNTTFGYDPYEPLNPSPTIEPTFATHYVLGLVTRRRQASGHPPPPPLPDLHPVPPTRS